ncbi:MAG: hypothetical protein JST48_02810 [Bacteroidetes bacterium]|nr:hypothetical protein [Bacteroidota bacterium]
MKKIVFVFSIAGLFVSCQHKNQVYNKPYFDFDSLLRVQVKSLAEAHAKIEKRTILNGKADTSFFVPDSTQWHYELDAFQQLDVINKPAYKNSFDRQITDDAHSNLQVTRYSAKGKSTVPELKFYYLGKIKLKKIEATLVEDNLMMAISQKLVLEFDDGTDHQKLIRYFVEGQQKMILSNPVKFSVEAIVD